MNLSQSSPSYNLKTQENKLPLKLGSWNWVKLIALFIVSLTIILSIAGLIRRNTFWLPHWRGDQGQYLTLAAKLDSAGFAGYNLRESKIQMVPINKNPLIVLAIVSHGKPGEEGDLLSILKKVNAGYYDEPLHMRAPLFPYLIKLSHDVFAKPNQPFVVCSTNLGRDVLKFKPKVLLDAQFYLAIVPLAFNLMTILLICLLGWRIFKDKRIGIYAGLMMALNPVSIFLAHRLLNEDVATALVTLSLAIFIGVNSRKRIAWSWVAGAVGGLSVLTNQKMGLVILVVAAYCYFCRWEEIGGRKARGVNIIKTLVSAFFDPALWLYAFGLFSVSGFWFLKVNAVYGDPLHMPGGIGAANIQDVTGWFSALNRRPHPILLFSLGTILICPLFAFAFLSWPKAYRRFAGKLQDKESLHLLFLWIWTLVFYVYLCEFNDLFAVGNKEHRYFYVVYPALCLISAHALSSLRCKLSKWRGCKFLADSILITLFIAASFYTVPMGMDKAFSISMLF